MPDNDSTYRFAAGFEAGYDAGWFRGWEQGFDAGYESRIPGHESERLEQRELLIKAYKAMPYPEYLKTSHWQAVRERYKKKLGDTFCQLDRNHSGPFDIHHNTYDRLGHERLEDLVCLCRSCHDKHHGRT